jgi:hypothetical protein
MPAAADCDAAFLSAQFTFYVGAAFSGAAALMLLLIKISPGFAQSRG